MKPIKLLQHYVELLDKKKRLDDEIEMARNMAMDEMHKVGLKSIKTDKATASLATRVTKDVNEREFRNWASQQPDVEVDLFYVTSLDNKRVADFSTKWATDTGEILPFISVRETEYISIRNNK